MWRPGRIAALGAAATVLFGADALAGPEVETTSSSYEVGTPITVRYINGLGDPTDWVSIRILGTPADNYVSFLYTWLPPSSALCDMPVGYPGQTTGEVDFPEFPGANIPVGEYLPMYFAANDYDIQAQGSFSFTVSHPPGVVPEVIPNDPADGVAFRPNEVISLAYDGAPGYIGDRAYPDLDHTEDINDGLIPADRCAAPVVGDDIDLQPDQMDWLGIAPSVVPDDRIALFQEWVYVPTQFVGAHDLDGVVPPGEYVGRLYQDNSFVVLATSDPFLVDFAPADVPSLAAPLVSTDPGPFDPNDDVVVTWSGTENADDWVGIHRVGEATDDYYHYADFAYTDGIDGSMAFALPVGTYEAILLSANTYTIEAVSAPFTVAHADGLPATIEVDTTVVTLPDGTVTVTWDNLPGGAFDHVGIGIAGEPLDSVDSYADLFYTGGGTDGFRLYENCTGVDPTAVECHQLPVGTYVARAFAADAHGAVDEFDLVASSATFTVDYADPLGADAPAVSADAAHLSGDPVSVSWANFPGFDADEVAVAAAGAPIGAPTAYLDSRQASTSGDLFGSGDFFSYLAPGTYQVRGFSGVDGGPDAGSYDLIATFDFTTTYPDHTGDGFPDTPTITPVFEDKDGDGIPEPTFYERREFDIDYAFASGNDLDWIGIVETSPFGAPTPLETDYVAWTYIDGAISGTVTSDGSLAPGNFYVARLFYNNTYELIAESEMFLILEAEDLSNNDPVAEPDVYTVDEDNLLVVDALAGVLSNDYDIDGDPLTLSLSLAPVHGTLVGGLNADGSFTYQPDPDYFGPDSFNYLLEDPHEPGSDVGYVTIDVQSVNDLPVVFDKVYSTPENVTLDVDAVTGVVNDATDLESAVVEAQLDTDVLHGDLTLNADGSFTYVPDPGYSGPDSFTFYGWDGEDQSALPATATIDVIPSDNLPPVAVDDNYTTPVDTPLLIAPGAPDALLANDSDPDGDPLTVTDVSGATTAGGGVVILDPAEGTFVYSPPIGFTGTDTFTYKAFDGLAASNLATVTIEVGDANLPPIAIDDAYLTVEDFPVNQGPVGGLLENDSDSDGPLPLSALEDPANPPSNGDVTIFASGAFSYVPDPDFNGVDTFGYFAFDGEAQTPATVTITVNPRNDPPVVVDDVYTMITDTILSIPADGPTLLNNDSDPDGDPLNVIGGTPASQGLVSGLAGDGSFTYQPPPGYTGPVTWRYLARDPSGAGGIGDVLITVLPAPVVSLDVDKAEVGFTDLDGDGVISPGDIVMYEVAYSNLGTDAGTDTLLTDDPDETWVVDVVNISDGGIYDGDVIAWDLGTVDAAASGSVTYEVELAAVGVFPAGTTVVANTATLSASEDGPHVDTEEIDVIAVPEFTVEKMVTSAEESDVPVSNEATVENDALAPVTSDPADTTVTLTDRISYDVVVSNVGNATSTNTQIVDALPAGTSFDAATGGTGHIYDPVDHTVTWTLADMAPGDVETVTLTILVD